MTTFTTTPPPDDQLTLLVWFIVRFKPDATNKDEALRRGTIFPVPGSYLSQYAGKPGWDWMRLDEFWKRPEVAAGESNAGVAMFAQFIAIKAENEDLKARAEGAINALTGARRPL